jgi:hypothetical protein
MRYAGPTTQASHPERTPVSLDVLVAASQSLPGVRRREVTAGDRLVVATRNSIYVLLAAADGRFVVSGGLFARQGRGPLPIAVNGCTAGGRALFSDLVAAPELFLEFADGTTTTRIRSVRLIPAADAL